MLQVEFSQSIFSLDHVVCGVLTFVFLALFRSVPYPCNQDTGVYLVMFWSLSSEEGTAIFGFPEESHLLSECITVGLLLSCVSVPLPFFSG